MLMKSFTIRFSSLLLMLLFVTNCTQSTKNIPDDQPRKIELLFLGHASEHHNSRKYVPLLMSALSKDGINITYTEDVNDLNSGKLSLYDGLILYANHEKITGPHVQPLLDFVEQGHAFLPIHCASFCFNESEEYVKLVGGQFKSHGKGIFTGEIVNKEHPIMESFEEFSTWDETYVHDHIADDITVLMERVEGDHREPWTWVKEYGKGKIFYTAYGHDERTWSNPGFQDLIKRGVLWAVDENVKKNWEAFSVDIPTLKYKEADNIPNYEKRDPAPKYQLPLTPEESKKLIQVPAGFDIELFAAEPDIINPIAMNWDERGRLWVIETVDYPNTVRNDKGMGDDRIKICEDTNGDGKADTFTIFADKLNIPTSFVFSNGGIIVAQAPHFLFLKDTDGDDKADVKEVLIDGWGTFDTHAGPSNLQYGIDNKVYGVVGYSGFNGNILGTQHKFGQGIYRFNHDLSDFEFVTSTSNNTWGLGITEDNSIFASTANNTHSVFMGIPNQRFEGVKGIEVQGSAKIDGHYDIKPITNNIRQVDVFGGFTAAAGHHFYTARNYPKEYWNKVSFVCEPTGNLVHIAKINEDGSGYTEQDGGNLMASADEWVSPVEAKVGPDGNVWVLDWYNFIIQHNPTPRAERGGYDAVNGDGNAYINPLRDKSRGRIWKIFPKNTKNKEIKSLDRNNSKELIKALSDDNLFWRLTAQRLLIENGDKSVLPDLYALAENAKVDGQGFNSAALHALWTIEGLGVLIDDENAVEVAIGALSHPSNAVRKAAIEVLPKSKRVDAVLIDAKILYDKDPKVVLAALLYFSERESIESLGEELYKLSLEEQVINDEWLTKATYIAASKHKKGFLKAFEKANPTYNTKGKQATPRQESGFDDSTWKQMKLPQFIETAGLDIDGIIWFRKSFRISKKDIRKSAKISLGPIDDSDVVYINGKKVGGLKGHKVNRLYTIPSGVLIDGDNIVAVRVEDTGGGGGIYGSKDLLFVKIGERKIPLFGTWKYEVEFSNSLKEMFKAISIAELLIKNSGGSEVLFEETSDSNDNISRIHIKTIKNEMKYDITEFVVETGVEVELVFENTDFMQHNLVIIKRGTKEKVGLAADKLASDPKGAEKNYVPEMDEVIIATAIINPEEKTILKFTAPTEPGIYPYICTFPGHWRIMQGVMKVVANK